MALKDHTLLMTERALVADQLATNRHDWLRPLVMQGAAAGLDWVLSAAPSPAPLSGQVRNPRDWHDVRAEATYAEEVAHSPGRFPELVSFAARPGMDLAAFASGLSAELEWATGATQSAMGFEDDELADEVEDLALEV